VALLACGWRIAISPLPGPFLHGQTDRFQEDRRQPVTVMCFSMGLAGFQFTRQGTSHKDREWARPQMSQLYTRTASGHSLIEADLAPFPEIQKRRSYTPEQLLLATMIRRIAKSSQ